MFAFKFGDRAAGGLVLLRRPAVFLETVPRISRHDPSAGIVATEKPNLGVCHIPGYVDQPLFIWVHCKAGKMYPRVASSIKNSR